MVNHNWSVKALSRNVHVITVLADWRRPGFEFEALLTSDWHYDHPKCNRTLLRKHLGQALEKKAPVFCNGDAFCVMQGKKDRRGSKGDVRPEHMVADYFDAVPRSAAEELAEFAPVLAGFGYGNHETAIIKHNETDVLRSFVSTLNQEHGAKAFLGGYGGWLFFRFVNPKNPKEIMTKRMKYFHGSGGGGIMSKGTLTNVRQAAIYPDADIVHKGHIHELWEMTLMQESVTSQGRVYHKTQKHICTSAYKEEYGDGAEGWHIERGAPPKPLGGYWLKFQVDKRARAQEMLISATQTV